MEALTFRFASVQDAPELARLNRQLIDDEGHTNPMTQTELTMRMRRWIAGDEYTAVLFRGHEDPRSNTAGYILYHDEGKHVYIRHFFVARENRRAGIGRRMLTLLSDRIAPRKRITLEVLFANERARKFYLAMGFAEYAIVMERLPD